MNKLFTKIGTAMVGIAMAIGVGVAVRSSNSFNRVFAADGTEHPVSPFDSIEQLLNNGEVPDDINLPDPGYAVKQVKFSGTHSKSTSITAVVTIGSEELASGSIGGGSPWNATIGDGSKSLSGAINVHFTSTLSGTKKGTITISSMTLVEGNDSSKTNTTVTLTAAGNKTRLELGEEVQLTSVVKDKNSQTIDGASVSYQSSDETVATVSASGLVTASSSKLGSATITATYAGNESYNGSTSTLKIKVVNPLVSTYVIEDVADTQGWEDTKASPEAGTIGFVTIVGSGTVNNTKYYSSDESWRFYSSGDGAITVSVSGYHYIKKVTFTADDYYFTTAPAKWTYSNKVFTPNDRLQTSVTFSNGSGTSKITQIEVEVAIDWCKEFINTFTCTGATQEHPNGDISVDNPSTVWETLSTLFSKSDSALKTALKTLESNENGTMEQKAMARYDLVVRKYGKNVYSDFIGRFGTGGINQNGLVPTSMPQSNNISTLIIIIAAVLTTLTVGGVFLLRKKEEK